MVFHSAEGKQITHELKLLPGHSPRGSVLAESFCALKRQNKSFSTELLYFAIMYINISLQFQMQGNIYLALVSICVLLTCTLGGLNSRL